jgi:hypothetical protein
LARSLWFTPGEMQCLFEQIVGVCHPSCPRSFLESGLLGLTSKS